MKLRLLPFCALAFVLPGLTPALSAAPKIGVLLKGRSDFWSAVEKGAVEAGNKLGAEVIVKAPPSESDVAVQIRLLASLGAQGIDALVIAPTNEDTLAGPVAALAAKGVKIVVIDSPLAGSVGAPFVGTNQNAAGEAAGRLLGRLIGDGDELSVLKHSQNSVAAEQREAGALSALRAAHPGLPVHSDVYASSEAGAEPERCAFLLEKHPGTKAILAAGSPGTMAMLQLLRTRKGGAIKFVGFGFNLNAEVAAAIAGGTMDGWVAQLPEDVGFKGVQAAADLLAGRAVPPVVSTDFIVITKENLQDPKVQALLN
ncbi:MAG TPA: substrate-binding domain-containing protein [Opitutaceae bacterium]|jgi:ribose transport system substrate-binding protein|nr:substrate-binding domain-containing protein [Opitutaceae bacterium]